MSIPDDVAAEILAKCGRNCCICRRFRPTKLQVHHIIEKSKGGTDDPDNLIAACITCHSDVHTHRPFARRFSPDELKQHRDAVFKLVEDGKLIPPNEELTTGIPAVPNGDLDLLAEAVSVLIGASQSDSGRIQVEESTGWLKVTCGEMRLHPRTAREIATLRQALDALVERAFLKDDGRHRQSVRIDTHCFQIGSVQYYTITHSGYLAADEFAASQDAPTEAV